MHNFKPKTLFIIYFILLTGKCLLMIEEILFNHIEMTVAIREILSAVSLLTIVCLIFSTNKQNKLK